MNYLLFILDFSKVFCRLLRVFLRGGVRKTYLSELTSSNRQSGLHCLGQELSVGEVLVLYAEKKRVGPGNHISRPRD